MWAWLCGLSVVGGVTCVGSQGWGHRAARMWHGHVAWACVCPVGSAALACGMRAGTPSLVDCAGEGWSGALGGLADTAGWDGVCVEGLGLRPGVWLGPLGTDLWALAWGPWHELVAWVSGIGRVRMRMCACTPEHSIQNKPIARRNAELERRRHAPALRTARARPHAAARPRSSRGARGGATGPWVGKPDGAE